MSSWIKLSKTNPQAEPDLAARRAFREETMEENNTTTQDPSAAQELYLPTKISGLYISPTIRALPDCIEIATRQPGATEYHIQWSSCWSKEKLALDDTVTLPTVKNMTFKTVDKNGRTGSRVPGIFVASEEVEESLAVRWTIAEGTETIIEIRPVGKGEADGFVMVYIC